WELVENSEGHEYYWNTKTGETSWTSPFGTNEAALIPELLSSGPPPPPPLPPVMKFPPPMSGAVPNDPELAALSRIESVPESIIRREGYLLTKKKSHGLASKKQSSSWVQHWAVLCVGFLFLFKDQATKTSTKRPLHVLRLDVVSVDEVGKEMTKKKGAFRLELEPGVVWLLQPGKEGEMWEWMDSVKEASRQKSTTPEYENALSKLLPATSGSERQAGSAHATRSSSNLSTVNSPATASTPVAGKSSDRNRSPKQSVKTKIGAFLFKRPSVDKLKEQGIIKDEDVIFGGSLAHQVEHSAQPIPPVVRKCVEEVDKRGLTSQGIYRLSGNASTVQKLRLQFNSKEPVDLSDDDMDINVVASTLKLYFRELEDPLVPFGFYDRFIAAAKLDDYDTRLIELKNLVQALPRPNYDTFEYIIRHLARVTSHSAENKMEPSNLAIVFGPTLIRAPENGAQSGYNTILNMSYQNLLVEAVLVQVDWVFDGLDN
ncbi:Rho GTPase activation protein, partial [Powellomyces hirtus]